MPFLPFFAMFINYVLLSYLGAFGAYLFIAYGGSAIVWYFLYGIHNSVGNNSGWADMMEQSKQIIAEREERLSKEEGRSQCIEGVDSADLQNLDSIKSLEFPPEYPILTR